jgi:hypothetical protein
MLVTVLATLGLVLAAPAAFAQISRSQNELAALRAATAKYHNVNVAVADGYAVETACVSSPEGTMGIHYINHALFVDPAVDSNKPEGLVYLPDEQGNLRLVAAEFLVPDADQDLTTDSDRPSIYGQPFKGPMPGHTPGMPIHYDIHVWVWEPNPAGMFNDWNPSISCPN